MFGKKYPVLTATFCIKLETVRVSVEVSSGQPVRFEQVDFNTGRGKVWVGKESKEISFCFSGDGMLEFNLGDGWISAFIFGTTVRIKDEKKMETHTDPKGYPMWWVGTGVTDRREELMIL